MYPIFTITVPAIQYSRITHSQLLSCRAMHKHTVILIGIKHERHKVWYCAALIRSVWHIIPMNTFYYSIIDIENTGMLLGQVCVVKVVQKIWRKECVWWKNIWCKGTFIFMYVSLWINFMCVSNIFFVCFPKYPIYVFWLFLYVLFVIVMQRYERKMQSVKETYKVHL